MNQNTFITCKPFIRADYTSKRGTQIIYLRITIPKNYLIFSTGIEIMPENWKKNAISKNETEAFYKNKRLKKLISKAQDIIDNYFYEGKTLTKEIFRTEFFIPNNINFFEWAHKELKKMNIGSGTYKAYKSKLNIFKKHVGNITITDITSQMLEKLRAFLINTSQNENSANKTLAIIKVFINIAYKNGLIEKNPYDNIRIKEIKGNRKALTLNQLNKLEKLNVRETNKIVLNQFLFACYTGLSYSDIYDLKPEHIFKEVIADEHQLILRKNRLKTKNKFSVPLIPKAIEIFNTGDVFIRFTNQFLNRELKKIAKLAEIEMDLTFHIARHTFATIALNKGIPIEVISKMLAHTQIKTTEIYAKVSDEYKVMQMKKLL